MQNKSRKLEIMRKNAVASGIYNEIKEYRHNYHEKEGGENMIRQLRVDERLIHGQITTNWSRALDISAIIVANDQVVTNKVLKQSLLMAKPDGKKVLIKSIEDTIKILDDPRADSVDVLLIVNNLDDAYTLQTTLHISEVNVANFNLKKGENKTRLLQNLSLTPEDYEKLRKLCGVCDQVYSQMLPTSGKVSLNDLLKKQG